MINNLPAHGFKWKNGEDFTTEKIDELVKKKKRGYILEVVSIENVSLEKSQMRQILPRIYSSF